MNRHTYDPDSTGRCTNGWYNNSGRWIKCNSAQAASVLHDDPAADFRQAHDHGGGDCMCFESEDGPSYSEAMAAYVNREAAVMRREERRFRDYDNGIIAEDDH
jgi:hypothetical protein